ncbi:unnamed protein product [Rotaria sordida]|uniref:Pre-rRNA-processing protein TSR2 homolog n=1 Tax=Rotaria sordida TaxID=392033 RepID=A0A818WY52_9BILA|nr:unnamed protein product [Rotaria sordida]CAF0915353.1 unnamed protein product [Rotaria sordida]CAF1330786.1 unnamed protein product [Rotaria sordida]CAF1591516.1 unnamed protein product [Rotaria sordida]CAF3593673.1 unnamed protein product [Rotaria sordida]
MSLLLTIVPIIRSVFSRWTALQLAVIHSMGGSETQAKYEAFIEAFGEYLTRNIQSSSLISANENNIQEYLDEILDEEFNTVLDDGSSYELALLFVRYIDLILQGKLNDVQQELQLQNSIISPVQMSIRNDNNNDNEDSLSSSESENDMIKEEIEIEKPKTQSMDIDEDGWTTVRRRNGEKK